MNEKRMKDALEAIARRGVPEDANLMPSIAARLERRTLMTTLRARPVLTLVLVLMTLALLTGAAYAIGRMSGYIPGIGMVDQSVPLRVLAEPVTVTREGITLTVEQAVLSADKTVLVYRVEGIPADAYASEGEGGEPNSVSVSSSVVVQEGTPVVEYSSNVSARCVADERLILPDGMIIRVKGGGMYGWLTGFESRYEYDPVPADVNSAVFAVACIDGTTPGKLPEGWEIPLRFVPAPPEMTVFPVIEVTTTGEAQRALTIEKVIETDDGYILMGKFRLIGYPPNVRPNGVDWLRFIDANGMQVEAYPASMQFESTLDDLSYPWAYEIKGKQHAFPLTIVADMVSAYIFDEITEFEFDTGDSPTVGQTWTYNDVVRLAGYDIRRITITRTGNGYEFRFETHPDLLLFELEIDGFKASQGFGGSDGVGSGKSYQSLEFQREPPSGKLKVKLTNPQVVLHGPWQMQWSPQSAQTSLYDISLHVDHYIPLEDGYYLIGHTEWKDERIVRADVGGLAFKAFDSSGREIPIEPASGRDDFVSQGLQDGQWAYRLYGKNFLGPLTLRATQVGVEFKQPVKFTLDLRSADFDFSDSYLGKTWDLGNIPLDVPGIPARVSSVTYTRIGDLHGFEITIQADPVLQGLAFSVESGLVTEGTAGVAGGGGSSRDAETGVILSTVITNARMQFPLVLTATGTAINGNWETTWNPPVDHSGSQPVFIEQACLDLPRWKQIAALADTMPLPAELTGKLLTLRGALAPSPSLFLSNLDGSAEQGLVFGRGSISPDGTQLAYSDENGVIKLLDIASGVMRPLGAPPGSALNVFWSPDGRRIAFEAITDTSHVYVMDANGEDLRQLTFGNEATYLRGWTGDGKQVLTAVNKDFRNYMLQLVNIETAEPTNLFSVQGEYASISPDGEWIAFVDKVRGRMGGGIHVSRLDGSERRLLAQLNYWMVGKPVWSPDGKWLAFSIFNTDVYNPANPQIAAINVDMCWIVPLPNMSGEPVSWISR